MVLLTIFYANAPSPRYHHPSIKLFLGFLVLPWQRLPGPVKNKTRVLLLKFGEVENLIAWRSSPWEKQYLDKRRRSRFVLGSEDEMQSPSPVCVPPHPPQHPGNSEAVPLQRSMDAFTAPRLRALKDIFPAVICGEEGVAVGDQCRWQARSFHCFPRTRPIS